MQYLYTLIWTKIFQFSLCTHSFRWCFESLEKGHYFGVKGHYLGQCTLKLLGTISRWHYSRWHYSRYYCTRSMLCPYQVYIQVYIRCILGLYQVYAISILGLYSGLYQVYATSILGLYQVCTRSVLGLYLVYTRSILGLYQVYTRHKLGNINFQDQVASKLGISRYKNY